MKRSESASSGKPSEYEASAAASAAAIANSSSTSSNMAYTQTSKNTIEVTKDPGKGDSPPIKYVFERRPTVELDVSIDNLDLKLLDRFCLLKIRLNSLK